MTTSIDMDRYFATRDAYLTQFRITATYRDLFVPNHPNPFAPLVTKFVDDIVKADGEIARLGEVIADRVARVNSQIAKGQHINSLGELQRTPVEYDQQCVARQTAIENLRWVAGNFREADGAVCS